MFRAKPRPRLVNLRRGRHQRLDPIPDRQRRLGAFQRFQQEGQRDHRIEMARLQGQSALQIGNRRTPEFGSEIGLGPQRIARRKIGRVVDQGGQMANRFPRIAAKRIFTALAQQIHCRRAAFAHLLTDFLRQLRGAFGTGLAELRKERIKARTRRAAARQHKNQGNCRKGRLYRWHSSVHMPRCSIRNPGCQPQSSGGTKMSDVITKAVEALNGKLDGQSIGGSAKFVVEDEGAIFIDDDGARAGDDEADVTLTASAETFEGMMSGDENPTTAFMTGKLKVDGDMGLAMKLAGIL